MRLSVNRQEFPFQIIFVILLAACTFYLIQIFNLFQFFGLVGISTLLIISILKVRAFLFVLLAIKPFIDLTWNAYFFSMSGKAVNPLHIVGFYTFIIVGYLYFFEPDNKKIFNERIIWLFLGVNVFTSMVAFIFYELPVIRIMDTLLRIFDAYFIYFIFHRFIKDNISKLRIFGIIWISTLLVSILSIITYLTGNYNIDIHHSVVRFAGLYNDPGGPSYVAIMSLIFGTLYLEIYRKHKKLNLKNNIIYILTILITMIILIITITKSAVLMFTIFLLMWIGLFKKKLYIILPLIIMGIFYIYRTSEQVQIRMEDEVSFFREGEFTIEAARPMGTGRVAHWERVLRHYNQNFSLFQKYFGSAMSFGAHNQYIAYLMQAGLIGLIIFLIILFRFYKRLIFSYKKYKIPDIYMGIVVLTMFALYGLFGHPFDYTTLLWYLMILLSLINVNHLKSS